ncbi:MAG: hypothetical protein PVG03_00210 [Desulfarculaceae bacterium]|jgi:hypothetical protein
MLHSIANDFYYLQYARTPAASSERVEWQGSQNFDLMSFRDLINKTLTEGSQTGVDESTDNAGLPWQDNQSRDIRDYLTPLQPGQVRTGDFQDINDPYQWRRRGLSMPTVAEDMY